MTYAVSAWWGYTTAAGKQRLAALIHRAVRVSLYPADRPNLHQLVAGMNDALFARIQANEHRVLQQLLPAPTCYKYVLRSRRHNYTLSIKTDYDDPTPQSKNAPGRNFVKIEFFDCIMLYI